MKSSVEIESLQEQLRVRKEKQYQLLHKLQIQEDAWSKAEDHTKALENKMKELHTKASLVELKMKLEMNNS